jgi:5-methyltetrahydrofolate--homocysteine methyltransferase
MTSAIQQLLAEKTYLLADGATGTSLFAMGLTSGDCPELWNRDHPERIEAHYQSYIDAGSDIILTNSFGGNCFRLKLHQLQDEVGSLNEAAARIAREAVDRSGRNILVAGSMGPTGELFVPMGALEFDSAKAAFAEQALALQAGGVDLLWIETLSSTEELDAALAGAAQTGLPVIATLSFDSSGRSMMGVTPEQLSTFCAANAHLPEGWGANCGTGPAELVSTILGLSKANPQALIVAKGNCGIPQYVEGEIRYDGTPELMADYVRLALDAGARIIGGCCGTTPEHIRAMRAAMEGYTPGERPTVEQLESRLGAISTGAKTQCCGESNNSAGESQRRRRRK